MLLIDRKMMLCNEFKKEGEYDESSFMDVVFHTENWNKATGIFDTERKPRYINSILFNSEHAWFYS